VQPAAAVQLRAGFQIRQVSGRSRVALSQEPSRSNNYTAMIAIEDRQGGGDNYAFEVTWRAEGDVANAPAPFFDDVRACQDLVSQRFMTQNGRGSYIDFETFADRQNVNQDQGGNYRERSAEQSRDRNQGRGSAKNLSETREITYSCVVNTQQGLVQSGDYQYSGGAMRLNGRSPLK
jgi:hypothetical protein